MDRCFLYEKGSLELSLACLNTVSVMDPYIHFKVVMTSVDDVPTSILFTKYWQIL